MPKQVVTSITQVHTKCDSCNSINNLILYQIELPSSCQECAGEAHYCDQCLKGIIRNLTDYVSYID